MTGTTGLAPMKRTVARDEESILDFIQGITLGSALMCVWIALTAIGIFALEFIGSAWDQPTRLIKPLLILAVLAALTNAAFLILRRRRCQQVQQENEPKAPYGSILKLGGEEQESFEQEWLSLLEDERQWQKARASSPLRESCK
jgi:hypothetical protein